MRGAHNGSEDLAPRFIVVPPQQHDKPAAAAEDRAEASLRFLRSSAAYIISAVFAGSRQKPDTAGRKRAGKCLPLSCRQALLSLFIYAYRLLRHAALCYHCE